MAIVIHYGYRKSKRSLQVQPMASFKGVGLVSNYCFTSSESSSWLAVLAVREKSERAVGPVLLFLKHINTWNPLLLHADRHLLFVDLSLLEACKLLTGGAENSI